MDSERLMIVSFECHEGFSIMSQFHISRQKSFYGELFSLTEGHKLIID